MDLLQFLVRFPDYKVKQSLFHYHLMGTFPLQGIRDIFKQLLEKVQMLMSHTPIQDIEKVFKFYTVSEKGTTSLRVWKFFVSVASSVDYESG